MAKPYYQEEGITIYHGDCREIMPLFPVEGGMASGASAVLVCDPPYGLNCDLNTKGDRIANDEKTDLRDWLAACNLPTIMFGSPKIPKPASTKLTLIWDKSELTGMGNLDLPWKATHEEIYIIGEGFKAIRRRGSVLRYPLRPPWTNHPNAVSGLHPNEKPVGLMVDLLECCPMDEIWDATCGSGATLEAAKMLGKIAYGIELEEKYCEIAANRLRQSVLNFEVPA